MRTTSHSIVLLLLLLLQYLNGFSQSYTTYSFPKDDSLLKVKYYQSSALQTNAAINAVNKERRKQYGEIYNSRLEQVQDLILSSRTITAPPLNDYLQNIVNAITNANPQLEALNARVFFTRDWWPNAVSLGEGSIAINAGLLIHLENEAELAFVICHELAHEYLRHGNKAIETYITSTSDDAFRKELKRLSKEKYGVNRQVNKLGKMLAFTSMRHSRLHEKEADSAAIIFLSRTDFTITGAVSALQKLEQVDERSSFKPLNIEQTLSFSNFPFNQRWIEKENGIFSAINTELTEAELKEQDSLKTHPDCKSRIAYIRPLITQPFGGKVFFRNEEKFKELKKDFALEIAEQCFQTGQLSRHLYLSLLLINEEEDRAKQYAAFAFIRGLNKLYEHQQAHTLKHLIDKEDNQFSVEYNQLLRMLNRLTLDEISAIANEFITKNHASIKADYPGYEQEYLSLKNRLKK